MGAWHGCDSRGVLSRRLFLKQLIVACVAALSWLQATGAELTLPPAPESSFSIVVIPDSQKYLGRGTKMQPKSTNEVTNAALHQHTRWIVDNLNRQRIVFVSHVGDIVDKNVPEQWTVARQCMDRLHGRVPYGIAPGNHDHGRATQTTLFQQFFGAARFAGMPWYGGAGGGSPGWRGWAAGSPATATRRLPATTRTASSFSRRAGWSSSSFTCNATRPTMCFSGRTAFSGSTPAVGRW
jgi:hypothetical protein